MLQITRTVHRSIFVKTFRYSSSAASTEKIDSKTNQSIVDKCFTVRTQLQNINDKCKGPLEKSSQKNTILPFVFLLGNHSSGKYRYCN